MSIISSGNPISFCDIICQYGGKYGDTALNVCINNYYAATTSCLVEPCTYGSSGTIPESGQISICQFYSSPVGFLYNTGFNNITAGRGIFIENDVALISAAYGYGNRNCTKWFSCGLIRIKCDGYIDNTFNACCVTGGCVFTVEGYPTYINRYDTDHYMGSGRNYTTHHNIYSYGIFKFCNNGCVNTSFLYRAPSVSEDRAKAHTIHKVTGTSDDGKVYIIADNWAVRRLCCNGCFDTSFYSPICVGTNPYNTPPYINHYRTQPIFVAHAGYCLYNGTTHVCSIMGLCLNGCLDTSFNSCLANGSVYAAAACQCEFPTIQADYIIGGNFTRYGATVRCGIAKISGTTGALNSSWGTTTGIKGWFSTVVYIYNDEYSKMTYISGPFTCVNGVGGYCGFARLCANGNTDTSFSPNIFIGPGTGANYDIRISTYSDCSILVVGDFICYGTDTVNGIVKLCFNGCIDRAY